MEKMVELDIRVTKRKPKTKGVGKYPFVTKNEIRAQILEHDSVMLDCLLLLDGKQCYVEQEKHASLVTNRTGWSASHAKKGASLALLARTEGLSQDQMSEARTLVLHYTTQLAAHLRQEMIAANPQLVDVAKRYSAA